MALSIGFRIFSLLPSCYSSYGALNFYPGGTFTHCSCQPSLDAHLSFPIAVGRDLQSTSRAFYGRVEPRLPSSRLTLNGQLYCKPLYLCSQRVPTSSRIATR